MEKRVVFKNKVLPYVLVGPQIIVTLVFFIWPASQALYQSVLQEDAFGLSSVFVGLENFQYIFTDPIYLNSIKVTAVFSLSVATIAMTVALLMAVLANRAIRCATIYKTFDHLALCRGSGGGGAVVWYFLFNPTVGMLAFFLRAIGIDWDLTLNGGQAMLLVIIAAAWRADQPTISCFSWPGCMPSPNHCIEAAAIDGAPRPARFWTITFPLLSPTVFFWR